MQDLKILQKTETLHEARWWDVDPDGRAHCYLCPRHCHIGDGQAGFCFIRVNQGGKLYSLGYGSPAALQIDPIEKKPLNHFLPGTRVFSHGHSRMQHGLLFLPELGHFEIAFRSSELHAPFAGRCAAAGDSLRLPVDCVYVQRADHLGRVRDRYLPPRRRSTGSKP